MDIAHYFRCCLNCGSLFPIRNTFLCGACWHQVDADRSKTKSQRVRRVATGKLEALTLWNWIPDKNDALSVMLAALKGWNGAKEWEFLARGMLTQRLNLAGQWNSDIEQGVDQSLIIPAPSLRPVAQDHAQNLAKELARLLQLPMLPVLYKPRVLNSEGETSHQRGRTRFARQNVFIKKRENFSHLDLSKSRVILIDDVLTTGETAAACIEALSPLKTYEIWCLAQRALL